MREYHDTAEERAMGKIDLWMHWTLPALFEGESLMMLDIFLDGESEAQQQASKQR